MPVLRLALLALLVSFPARAAEVTVFAAASLKTALDEIAAAWQAETGHSATLSYGGSPALAKQIIAAAPVDVFLSASPEWMDAVEQEGLIRDGTREDLLGNRLVLVAHGDKAPLALDGATDLTVLLDGGKLSMAMVDSVPAGQYGRDALTSLGLWDSVKGSVAQSENVRAALQLVALGEAPLGIVYASDALAEPAVSLIAVFPEDSHRRIIYPAAVIADSMSPVAEVFLTYLSSPEARKVFKAQGFLPPGAP